MDTVLQGHQNYVWSHPSFSAADNNCLPDSRNPAFLDSASSRRNASGSGECALFPVRKWTQQCSDPGYRQFHTSAGSHPDVLPWCLDHLKLPESLIPVHSIHYFQVLLYKLPEKEHSVSWKIPGWIYKGLRSCNNVRYRKNGTFCLGSWLRYRPGQRGPDRFRPSMTHIWQPVPDCLLGHQ